MSAAAISAMALMPSASWAALRFSLISFNSAGVFGSSSISVASNSRCASWCAHCRPDPTMHRRARANIWAFSGAKGPFRAQSSIVVNVGLVRLVSEARGIEIFQPGLQRRRGMSGSLHLPQGDPDVGAAVAIPCQILCQAPCEFGWRRIGIDRIPDPALDGEDVGISELLDHLLKGLVARRVERPGL